MAEDPTSDMDSGYAHDRELVWDVLAMSPRERLEELAVVEEFFDRAVRLR